MGIIIEKKLMDAGYRMLGDNKDMDTLIQDIIKTKNIRYLKAIPFIIYKYDLNVNSIQTRIKDQELFNIILNITARIFTELNINKKIPKYTGKKSKLGLKYEKEFNANYDEFKNEFKIQLRMDKKSDLLIDKQKIDEERNLQYNLSQLFTKKEKQIIKRLQEDKPISRTDYEYYSRKTRKKLRSIINLHDFAKNTYTKTPKYSEELYNLKKDLEKWVLNETKIENSIEEFHILEDKLIITLKDNSGEGSTNLWKLKKIKDKKLLQILKKYQEHDFS
ncbi:hypothetical protein K8R33_04750 [archaeon]|nr:hypothetical protein [archaeon]